MSDLGSLTTNVIRFLINFLARSAIAGVVVYCCWVPIVNYNYWFTWHVILCTLGYLPLMAESMMLFAGDELWSNQLTRNQKYWVHGVLITLGTAIVTAGSADIIYYTLPGYHFTTIHGVTGLISNILIIISILLGFFASFSGRLKGLLKPVVTKFIHNFVGQLGYVIGLVSICYAYYSDWFVFYTSEKSRALALVATILGGIWTMNSALKAAFGQVKAILSKD